ncbi:MAG: DNA phosphorothioation system sulfurtransferase DndC [Muribaculaceae bacterium]|nr:DNA phosphorothioation system sulfurtransferase DndC [Muribaculaceae bacterium]
MRNQRIEYIIDEILDQYAYADETNRPWIIGFSGGKDSTVLLMLVWIALRKLKELAYPFQLRRPIYVVCNDTMVENPIIASYVDDVLEKIETKARDEDLPIFVRKTTPRLEDSFWVNVIGKGYPVPNMAFRWCTDRMKIKPTSNFILDQVDECGEVIILIGARKEESFTRARSLKKHEKYGKRLTNHPTLKNTFVYAPIKELMLEEVWYIINKIPSPWDFDNSILFNIYLNASADDYECPSVVTDDSHSSCGRSRFGCWTCTVVKDDKSMRSLIKNGYEWMQPLYEFRSKVEQERNNIENRFPFRRDGKKAVKNLGPYTFNYRADLLKRLLTVQYQLQKHDPKIKLITNQELIAIQVNWYRDFNFGHQVSEIYNKIYNSTLSMEDGKIKNKLEADLMREICKENIEEGELIEQLLMLQKSKSLMQRRRGLKTEIESRLEEFVKTKKKS